MGVGIFSGADPATIRHIRRVRISRLCFTRTRLDMIDRKLKSGGLKCSGQRPALRLAGISAVLTMVLALGLVSSNAWAARGDSRLGVFVGTTSLRAGEDTTTGTTVGLGWGLEIQDQLLWSISAARTSSDGEREVSGQTFPLTADTTSFQTGLTHFFRPGATLVPFTGGGVSVAAYDVDYTYPGSEIGKSTGTSPGLFARLGLEVRFTRNFTLIPQYRFSVHSIRSDQGDSRSLVSDGLLLSLRFST